MKAVPCRVMRGGTSKGLYFNARDLPTDVAARDKILLAAMGSPDTRQIDGMGGAHPLTSKVAVICPSSRDDADVDYLFLQVAVDKASVSDMQNCGNILAGVGPFAVDEGLVEATKGITDVRIHMVNTSAIATASVIVKDGKTLFEGDTAIDGVPGTAAPVLLNFEDVAGSSCGALFPTGNVSDTIHGVEVTCIDNGMPVVLIEASSLGIRGNELPSELENSHSLKTRIESLRLEAGRMMNLADVTEKTIPKMTIISRPENGGVINTRSFIPHRVHDAIGVLGSISVATACVVRGTIAYGYSARYGDLSSVDVEHPTGKFTVSMEVSGAESLDTLKVRKSALVRTARLLMRGEVMIPEQADL